MKSSPFPRAGARLTVGLLCGLLVEANSEPPRGERGIAATVHPLATDAAMAALKKGGNAIDGAVAAALTLGE